MSFFSKFKIGSTSYDVKDALAGKSLSISGTSLSLKDAAGNAVSTVDLPGGGGLPLVKYDNGTLRDASGNQYSPNSYNELILLYSENEINANSSHSNFGGFLVDTSRNWNYYNLSGSVWRSRPSKYPYLIALATGSGTTYTVTILDTYKLIYRLSSPTANQIKFYTGGFKYKATSDTDYTELSSNLSYIDVADDYIVVKMSSTAHVQDIQMPFNTTNGYAMMLLRPIMLTKDEPFTSGMLYRFEIYPSSSSSTSYIVYKSTFTGTSNSYKMEYIIFEGLKNKFSN